MGRRKIAAIEYAHPAAVPARYCRVAGIPYFPGPEAPSRFEHVDVEWVTEDTKPANRRVLGVVTYRTRDAMPPHKLRTLVLIEGGLIDVGFQEASVSLTDAEIKTLNSVGKEILPAPGEGKVYQVALWMLAIDNAAGVYAGGGSVTLRLGGTPVTGGIPAAGFNGDAGVKMGMPAALATGTGLVAMVNTPLTLGAASADFTGGDPANKAMVRVVYRAVNAAPE